MERALVVSTPGKVMVSGEYAVLSGTPALVAAAAARARVHLSPRAADGSPRLHVGSRDPRPTPPEALLAARLAGERLGASTDMDLHVDTRALRQGDLKLGLGSSAAAAAGAVCAVASALGLDVEDAGVRRRLLPIALDGHRAIAPEGSGADVACSMLGGLVRVERRDEGLDARALPWPEGLALALVWTSAPARTSDLVGRVREAAARDASGHDRAMGPLREAALALLDAVEARDVARAIAAADAHHAAMAGLGRWADAPIVTPALEDAAAAAREVGGAAKPSGAGGGDVALVFLPGASATGALDRACRARGLTLLPVGLGDAGPRLETAA